MDTDPEPRPKQPVELPDGWRPLSEAEEVVVQLPTGKTVRLDAQGRLLCMASRRDKKLCKAPAIAGLRVCRMHGGQVPNARQAAQIRLADAVQPSIAKLIQLMAKGEAESTQLRAADSLLDRAGYGRQQVIDSSEAKEVLYQRLIAQQEAEAQSADYRDEDDLDPDYDTPNEEK